MGFSLEICQDLYAGESPEHPFPIDFDLAWVWAGYSRKDQALRTLRNLIGIVEGVDWISAPYDPLDCPQTQQTEFPPIGGNLTYSVSEMRGRGETDKYWLSMDTFEHFALSAQTQEGFSVRQHYIAYRRGYAALAAENAALLEYNRKMREYYATRSAETERELDWHYDRIDEVEAAQRKLRLKVLDRPTRRVYS